MQTFQDSDKFGGHPIFFMMTHRALRFTESNASNGEIDKGYVVVTVLLSVLFHKLSDSGDHSRRATVSSKAAL